MRGRTIVTVLTAGLMLLVSLAPFTAGTAPAAEATPLDLAAMALRPSDLAEPGYGVWSGYPLSAAEAGDILAEQRGKGADGETIARQLTDAGWQRAQFVVLGLPAADDPGKLASAVQSQLIAFDSAAGAAKGYDLIEDQAGIAGVSQHAAPAKIGDQALITIDRRAAKDTTNPYVGSDLTFRTGNLVATVYVTSFGPDAKPAADSVLVRLAGALARRIDAIRQGKDVPGLSTRALHLSGDAITTYYDEYERIGGVTIPYAGESKDATAARDTTYDTNKVTDAYTTLQTAGDYAQPGYGLYSLYVEHFARQKDAEAWLKGLTAGSVTSGGTNLQAAPVTDAPTFGDASTTFSYSYERSDKTTASGYAVYLRTGRTTAAVQVDSVGGVSLTTAGKVASAQAACQRAGDCTKPLASPLKPPSGAATPAASPAAGTATPAATPRAGAPDRLDGNGSWTDPTAVAPGTGKENPVQEHPVIAARPDGSLVAIWLGFNSGELDDDGNEPLFWAELPPGARAWTEPARIHASAFASNGHNIRGIVFPPALAALPDGSLALVWQQTSRTESRLWLSTMPAGGDTWTSPARLPGSTTHATYPTLAVGPRGELYAAWSQTVNGYTRPVFNERAADGTWDKATVVRTLPHHTVQLQDGSSQETGGYGPAVAAAPDGRVVVVWADTEGTLTSTGANGYRLVYSVRDAKTAQWGENLPVVPDDPTSLFAAPLAIAANADGFVLIAGDAHQALAWTKLPAGKDAWTAPATLAGESLHPNNPRLAVAPRGELVAVWRTTSAIHAAWLAPGATAWSDLPATFKGTTRYEYDVAVAADGRPAVIVSVSGESADLGKGIPAAVSVYTPGGQGSAKAQATPNPRADVKDEPTAAAVYRGNAAHTGTQPGPAPKTPTLLWAWAPARDGGMANSGILMAPPSMADGKLYVAVGGKSQDTEGRILAIDARTGKTVWTYDHSQPVVTAVTVAGGMAYAVTRDKVLLALDAETGKLAWQQEPASNFQPPAVVDGVVYISLAGTGRNGVVKALDAKTGKTIWETTSEAYLQGGPTVVDGVVYLGGQANAGPSGTYPAVLYAFDAGTGKARWQVTLPSRPNQSGDNAAQLPVVYGDMVYVSTKDGVLAAVDAKSGALLWSEQDCWSDLVVAAGVVYCGGSFLHAFDSLTGAELWEVENGRLGSDPVLVEDTLVFVGGDRKIYLLDTATRELATIPGVTVNADAGTVSPLVVDGTIYVNNGNSSRGASALLAIGDE